MGRVLVDPRGFVTCARLHVRCALGRGGIRAAKVEGDGATPSGEFRMGRLFYRAERFLNPPATGLVSLSVRPNMGWCDDPADKAYNQLITLPNRAHHEVLWRDDGLYDLVVELKYNMDPIEKGRGSAIFMHVARPNYTPTEGCIALQIHDLLSLLRYCNTSSCVVVSDTISKI